jgi:hypothetical protein
MMYLKKKFWDRADPQEAEEEKSQIVHTDVGNASQNKKNVMYLLNSLLSL